MSLLCKIYLKFESASSFLKVEQYVYPVHAVLKNMFPPAVPHTCVIIENGIVLVPTPALLKVPTFSILVDESLNEPRKRRRTNYQQPPKPCVDQKKVKVAWAENFVRANKK